ncbi:hypothetical protein psal_cds_1158 [Pandoravirus salinus]|uniref:Uncharacterized protein n=1 Tax=Pandoravirus salinus TaxID=1349410 RepID=S4VXN7_9VIRU|nr:hypothetical protein psal_cds_1158 [Pandoravirus salinus]AGO85429.2 hypothetical protein psal_cds_1158 [Pandoravirus salinus]
MRALPCASSQRHHQEKNQKTRQERDRRSPCAPSVSIKTKIDKKKGARRRGPPAGARKSESDAKNAKRRGATGCGAAKRMASPPASNRVTDAPVIGPRTITSPSGTRQGRPQAATLPPRKFPSSRSARARVSVSTGSTKRRAVVASLHAGRLRRLLYRRHHPHRSRGRGGRVLFVSTPRSHAKFEKK